MLTYGLQLLTLIDYSLLKMLIVMKVLLVPQLLIMSKVLL